MIPPKAHALIVAAALAASGVAAEAHIINFFAKLDGLQVVDPTNSTATGAASIKYDHHSFTINVKLYLDGIGIDDLKGDGPNDTPIHMHMAPVGENGPIVVDLSWWSTTHFIEYEPKKLFIQWDSVILGGEQGEFETDIFENDTALTNSGLYLDVHTNAYPAGEIRGQILPVPAPGPLATIAAAALVATRRRRAR